MAENEIDGSGGLRMPLAPVPTRGWYNMACWNGLSPDQREFLRTQGYLPLGYRPSGTCPHGAEVAIETMVDQFPGPRFYCRECAIAFLQQGEAASFTCSRCGKVSHHPVDQAEGYCGACHDWTGL